MWSFYTKAALLHERTIHCIANKKVIIYASSHTKRKMFPACLTLVHRSEPLE